VAQFLAKFFIPHTKSYNKPNRFPNTIKQSISKPHQQLVTDTFI
jgi:hypothetical protein